MARRQVKVTSELGLHARPATRFAAAAARCHPSITVSRVDGDPVPASSLLSVMSLNIVHGEDIILYADGEDAESALDVLADEVGQLDH